MLASAPFRSHVMRAIAFFAFALCAGVAIPAANSAPAPSATGVAATPAGVLGVYPRPSSTTTATGAGVIGVSALGWGVVASSSAGSASLLAMPTGSGNGIETYGAAASSGAGLYSEAKGSGDGIDAYADGSGDGVYADAAGNGVGIYGEGDGTSSGIDGINYGTAVGVYGYSLAEDGVHGEVEDAHAGVSGIQDDGGTGYGVYAANKVTATPGPTAQPFAYPGVFGEANTGPGVYGVDLTNTGTARGYEAGAISQSYAGLFGYGNDGPGLFAYGVHGIGAYVLSNGAPDGKSLTYPTLYLENHNGTGTSGMSLFANDDATGAMTVAYANGNFYTSGSITSGTDTYQAVTRNPAATVATYSAQTADATVEDVGSAKMVNGIATVAIAPDFRQTMNTALPYAIFLTPYGECNGLFVASRTPSGFTVRDLHGGHSTLAFDYRIVAHPYGALHDRLPQLASLVRIPALPRRPMSVTRSGVTNGASPIDESLPRPAAHHRPRHPR